MAASNTGFSSYKKLYQLFEDIIMDIKNKSLKNCCGISKLLYLRKKMKFYSDFTTQYVNEICQSLNARFENLSTLRDQPFVIENFETLTDFLQNYIVYSSNIFVHLNNLGLVNKGKCPYTGQKTDHSSPSWSYMNNRKVYLSQKGHSIMQKEDEENRRKVLGF